MCHAFPTHPQYGPMQLLYRHWMMGADTTVHLTIHLQFVLLVEVHLQALLNVALLDIHP